MCLCYHGITLTYLIVNIIWIVVHSHKYGSANDVGVTQLKTTNETYGK